MAWFDENAPTEYQPPAIAGGGYSGLATNPDLLNAPRRGDPGWYGYTDPKVREFDTTTTTTTPTATTGPGPVNGDWQTWFNTLTAGKPPTPDQLVGLESAINAAGGKVLRNA